MILNFSRLEKYRFLSGNYKVLIGIVALFIFLLLLLFVSSHQRSLPYEKLLEFVNDPRNNLQQSKSVNTITIKLTMYPSDLLVLQEIQVKDSITKQERTEIFERYNSQFYFILSFSQQGSEILGSIGNRFWFKNMVNQLSFGMGESISLATEKLDTLVLLDFNSPRYYGMSPSTDILLAYTKPKDHKYEFLEFSIKEFGLLTGDVKFRFNKKDIKKLPRLRKNDINESSE